MLQDKNPIEESGAMHVRRARKHRGARRTLAEHTSKAMADQRACARPVDRTFRVGAVAVDIVCFDDALRCFGALKGCAFFCIYCREMKVICIFRLSSISTTSQSPSLNCLTSVAFLLGIAPIVIPWLRFASRMTLRSASSLCSCHG